MARGTVRREVRIAVRADDAWASSAMPPRLPEWFPGIVEADRRRRHAGSSSPAPASPCPSRSSPTTRCLRRFQYRITAPMVVEHLGDPRRARPRRRTRAWSPTLRRRPGDDGAASSAAPPATRSSTSARPAGRTSLMGRKILFVTTDQQRYDTLGCNGGARRPHARRRRARRRGHPLRARHPAVGGVHAVALDHPHRPAPHHPRRVDERRAAAGRRAVGRRRAPRRRLPHRAHRQGPLRALPRPVPALHRERAWRAPATTPPGGHRTAASSTSSSPPTARSGPTPLRALARRRAPRGRGRLLHRCSTTTCR